jgi:hypothetical protein
MHPNSFVLVPVAVLAIALAGPVAAAQQVRSPFDAHSGDSNVANAAQITAPMSDPQAQSVTQRMLKNESSRLFDDYPVTLGDTAQISTPVPNRDDQGATERMLKKEAALLFDDYPVDLGGVKQVHAITPDTDAQQRTAMALEQVNQASGAITGQYD